ncbi:Protein SODIUM POTASSIUM ROOT DEFECTIVE 1, partial [Cucurbita argyrosperma subsp. sororia]
MAGKVAADRCCRRWAAATMECICEDILVVELRVSMHCNGCARRVEKNIGKIEGVDSYKVDFERKTVVVTGDVSSFEVIQCVSKVRSVEILEPQE